MKRVYRRLTVQEPLSPLKRRRTFPFNYGASTGSSARIGSSAVTGSTTSSTITGGTITESKSLRNLTGFFHKFGSRLAEIEGTINYSIPSPVRDSNASVSSKDVKALKGFYDGSESGINTGRRRILDKPFSRLHQYFKANRPRKDSALRITNQESDLGPLNLEWTDPDSLPKSFFLEVREALERNRDNTIGTLLI